MALLPEVAVGVALEKLLKLVSDQVTKARMFKHTLNNFECTLRAIAPVIDEIVNLNKNLRRPKGELEPLQTKLDEAMKLISKCSKIHRLNFVWRAKYQDELIDLENWILRFFIFQMQVQAMRDQKETLLAVKTILLVPVSSDSNPEPGEVLAHMLPARNLFIAWGDTPSYWKWTFDDRFSEVAELVNVCWLEIKGQIKTSMLSPKTLYEAYFVFKQRSDGGAIGFKNQALEVNSIVKYCMVDFATISQFGMTYWKLKN